MLEVLTAKEVGITDVRITGKASQLLTGDESQELAREELTEEAGSSGGAVDLWSGVRQPTMQRVATLRAADGYEFEE